MLVESTATMLQIYSRGVRKIRLHSYINPIQRKCPIRTMSVSFRDCWPCMGCFVCSKYTIEHKLPSNEERKHKAKVKIPNTAYPNHHINIEIPHCFKDHIYFTRNHLNYVSSWHWLKKQNNKVEHWWQENW